MPGSRANHLDRHAVAVVGYLQGSSSRFITLKSILSRWPWPSTKPTTKGLRGALRRLATRGVLDHRDDGYRVNHELQRVAAQRGARFRWLASDLTAGLSAPDIDLLALLRGRAAGRTTPWADSRDYLAELLGADPRTVGLTLGRLRVAGRLSTLSTVTLRTGHQLPVYTVHDDAEQPASHRESKEPLTASQEPLTAPEEPLTAQSVLKSVPTSEVGSSVHQLALVREAEPASRDQSRAYGADDPIALWAVIPEQSAVTAEPAPIYPMPQGQRQNAQWLDLEERERSAAASMSSWNSYEDALRTAVGDLHFAGSTTESVHKALIGIGVYIMPRTITAAGRLGLQQRREELAHALATQGAEPSLLLEAAHCLANILRRRGGNRARPRRVGAALRVIVEPKSQNYLDRSRNLVEAGKPALPMASGIDGLCRLVEPHKRLVGEFAYPESWWRTSVDQNVLGRIAAIRSLVGGVAATWEARASGGDIGASFVRQALAKRDDNYRRERVALLKDELTQAARLRHDLVVRRVVVQLNDLGVPRDEIERAAGAVRRHGVTV